MKKINRKERDRQTRKNDILRAAEHVFATKGFHKTTIADIAKEAQYAVGTIYLYFKDKQALYMTLIEQKTEDLASTVKERLSRIQDIKNKIKALINEQLAFFEKNKDFYKIYFSERANLRWAVKDRISKNTLDRYLRYLDYIAGIMKSAQRKNIIIKDVHPKRLAYILVAMLNTMIFPWLGRDSEKRSSYEKETSIAGSVSGMSTFIFDVFMNGASVRK